MLDLFAPRTAAPDPEGAGNETGNEYAVSENKSKTGGGKGEKPNRSRTAVCQKSRQVNRTRRLESEMSLEDCLDWHWEPGTSYHVISFGDVDAITYLRAALRQERLEYLLIATYRLAMTDVMELRRWVDRGMIGHLDMVVSALMPDTHNDIYMALADVVRSTGGRVCVAMNHAKVMAGFGDRFDFTVEGSSNMTTNPRIEINVISVDSTLARWFKESVFDSLESNFCDFPGWRPYNLIRDGNTAIQS